MTMAALLEGMSDTELRSLLARRPDLTSPPPRTFADLAARAAQRRSLTDAVVQLDEFALAVVNVVGALGQDATPESVAPLIAVGADRTVTTTEVIDAAGRLTALALADGGRSVDERIQLLGELRSLFRYPGGLGRRAATLLSHMPRREVDDIAVTLGVPAAHTKDRRIAGIVAVLSDGPAVRQLLARAPREAVDAALALASGDPTAHLPYHRSLPSSPRHGHWGWLGLHGLVLTADQWLLEMPFEVCVAIRGDIVTQVRSVEPPTIATTSVGARAIDAAGGAAATTLLRGLTAILDAWTEEPAPALLSGGLGVRELKRAARLAHLSEVDAARALEIARAAGLLAIVNGRDRPTFVPTEAYDGWLAALPAARWAALASAWLSIRGFATPQLDGGKRDAPLRPEWAIESQLGSRERLVDALRAVPSGDGADRLTLAAHVAWGAPMTFGPEPEEAMGLVSDLLDEAALFGFAAYDGLTSAARLLCDGDRAGAVAAAADHLDTPTTEFTIQADLTAVAPGALDPAIARELALCADVESTGAATVYRLSAASVRRALDAGRTADDLLDFLTAHASRGVPQPLDYLVRDVERRHGVVRAGAVQSYVQSDDPTLVAGLARLKGARPLAFRILAPGVAVSTAPVARVIEVLRANGLAPVEEDASGAIVVAARETHRAETPAPARATTGDVAAIDIGSLIAQWRAAAEDRTGTQFAPAMRSKGRGSP